MKLILFALFVAFTASVRAADASIPAPHGTNIETHIYSKTAVFEQLTRQVIYRGDVIVDDPRVHITCEILTAKLPTTGKRVDSIVAETNVIILALDKKGETNRATADKAVYSFNVMAGMTNEVLELTGSPMIESPQIIWTGTKLVWDRVKDSISGDDSHMKVRQLEVPPASSTNSSSTVPTNAVPAAPPATP